MERAIIIGAGPAGLTAAYELCRNTNIVSLVIEKDDCVGGIARTIEYKGNRIDIGGHRFFSKSDRVMDWWLSFFPVEDACSTQVCDDPKASGGEGAAKSGCASDRVMLIRQRKSRIYFAGKFFDYPVSMSFLTLWKLGALRSLRILVSYVKAALFPIKPERSLEDFFINRFGKELYVTFFKSYTEKVWGTACDEISADWGAQRVKGLSVWSAVKHALRGIVERRGDIAQKETETSLIEWFLYPKYGSGQLWEAVAEEVENRGGTVLTGFRVERIHVKGKRITGVEVITADGGDRRMLEGDYFVSSMPIRELIDALDAPVPGEVIEVSRGLLYRDFITVGILLNVLKIAGSSGSGSRPDDTWIYIQEPGVLLGRLQLFNNWSPYMVANPEKTWIGLEYFCFENDAIWRMGDRELTDFAIGELVKLELADRDDVIDTTVVRMPKAYPAYFGTYDRFDLVREYLDLFENLFLVGRNGMHKYNNQDHAMLTAMRTVDGIVAGHVEKSDIWAVNTELDYLEEK